MVVMMVVVVNVMMVKMMVTMVMISNRVTHILSCVGGFTRS